MRLLVTGSSGQIGSYVVEVARERGHETVGLDIQPDADDRTDVVADIRNPGACQRALEGVDSVVHCAAQISVQHSIEDPIDDASHNVEGTINLLEAAREAGLAGRFVNVSSAAVYGSPEHVPVDETHPCRPLSPYGASKLAAETYAELYDRLHGLETVTVRPFNVYSPRQDPDNPYSGVISVFADRIRDGKPPIVHGNGTQTRDFVHARDVAGWLVDLAEPDGPEPLDGWRALNLGTGRETSILELAETMIEASDESGELEPVHDDPRPGDIDRSVADRSRADKLGLEPSVPLEAGLKEMLA